MLTLSNTDSSFPLYLHVYEEAENTLIDDGLTQVPRNIEKWKDIFSDKSMRVQLLDCMSATYFINGEPINVQSGADLFDFEYAALESGTYEVEVKYSKDYNCGSIDNYGKAAWYIPQESDGLPNSPAPAIINAIEIDEVTEIIDRFGESYYVDQNGHLVTIDWEMLESHPIAHNDPASDEWDPTYELEPIIMVTDYTDNRSLYRPYKGLLGKDGNAYLSFDGTKNKSINKTLAVIHVE